MQEISIVEHIGALTVLRVGEVGSKQIFGMASKVLKFGSVVSGQEDDRFFPTQCQV